MCIIGLVRMKTEIVLEDVSAVQRNDVPGTQVESSFKESRECII